MGAVDLENEYTGYLTEYTKLQYMIDSELNTVYKFIKNAQVDEKPTTTSWLDLIRELRLHKDKLN